MATGGRVKFDITADASGVQRGVGEAEASLNRLNAAGKRSSTNLGGISKGADLAHGSIKKASGAVSQFGSGLIGLGGGATAALIGAGGVVEGLKAVAEKGLEAQAAQAKLQKATENAGISWKQYGGHIDETIKKQSLLSGFTKAELSDAFSNMIRTTGSVGEAFKLNGMAMDVARTKGTSLAQAQSLLARVYNGSYTGLKRLGIAVTPVTKAQDALKASTKNASDEQKRAAKAADALATRHVALAEIQKKFGGQTEAYAKTAAGSIARAKASFTELEESLGQKLLPAVAAVTAGIAKFVNGINNGTGAGGKFAHGVTTAFNTAKQGVQIAIAAISGFIQKNKVDILATLAALQAVGKAIVTFFTQYLLPTFKRALAGLVQSLQGAFQLIRGVVQVFVGLFTLDFKKMWEGIKNIFGGALNVLVGLMRQISAPFRQVASMLGGVISDAFHRTLGKLPGVFSDAFGAVTQFLGSLPGKFGSLMGNAATAMVGAFKGLGGRILDAIGQAGGAIAGFAKQIANGVIGLINSGLNSIQLDFSVLGKHIHIDPIPNNPIPQFARGGKVRGQGSGDTIPALLEPGEFVLNRKAVAAVGMPHLMALNSGVPRFQNGGPVASASSVYSFAELERIWIDAGGSPSKAAIMAHIAEAESGGDSNVNNGHRAGDGGHNIAAGLWQILGLPFPGNVYDPITNAKMAISKSGNGVNLHPWDSSRASWGQYVGQAGSAPAASVNVSGGLRGSSKPKPPSPYDKLTAQLEHIDLLVSSGHIRASQGTARKAALIRKTLPKLRGDNKLRAETDLRQLPKPPKPPKPFKPTVDRTLSNPWLQAALTHIDNLQNAGQLTPEEAAAQKTTILTNALKAKNGLQGEDRLVAEGMIKSLAPASNAGTPLDVVNNALNDIGLHERAGDYGSDENAAHRTALTSEISTLDSAINSGQFSGDDLLNLRAQRGDLAKELSGLSDNTQQLTDEIKSLKDEMKRQNDFAESVSNVSLGAAWKALADVISGQIAGVGYTGRALSAGAGSVARY